MDTATLNAGNDLLLIRKRFRFRRLVYDRETGKPKGYGFCEYQDVETAQSAMRNLNNHDFNGRPLRVGVAAGEQNKDEIKSTEPLHSDFVFQGSESVERNGKTPHFLTPCLLISTHTLVSVDTNVVISRKLK